MGNYWYMRYNLLLDVMKDELGASKTLSLLKEAEERETKLEVKE